MVASIHFVVVGIVYILASAFIYMRGRNNIYDKGISWVLFSLFHGIDELLDGISGIINFDATTHLFIEKIELISIYLASIYLMMTLFIQLGMIQPKQQGTTGLLTQGPVVILFLVMDKKATDALIDTTVDIFGQPVKLFIFILSVIPAILMILAYFTESIRLSLKSRRIGQGFISGVAPVYLSGVVMIIYAIGETFADVNLLYLYLEIVTIIYIMLTPIEINFGTNKSIQFFLIYHEQGLPLLEVRFNNRVSDDSMMLISGLLGAVNSLVGSELKMGNLRQIETETGYLLFEKRGKFIYAVLSQHVSVNIHSKFSLLIDRLEGVIGEKTVDINQKNEELVRKLEARIVQDLAVWV